MNDFSQRLTALLLAFALCFAMAGCSSSGQAQTTSPVSSSSSVSSAASSEQNSNNVANFSTETIDGETFSGTEFANYKITLVNLFATWCSPCVNEIPELELLSQDLASDGIGIIGVVTDIKDDTGYYEDAHEQAKTLKQALSVTYPLLVPDDGQLNGILRSVNSFPTTIFVDKDGNIVGETYIGARSYDDWKQIIQTELAKLGE